MTTSAPSTFSAPRGGTVPPRRAALSGVLAVALALAVSTLLAGMFADVPSLVVSVGDLVIDSAPSSVEQWAIATLGRYDKPALIAGILVISAAIGSVTGVASVRSLWIGVAVFAAFGAVGAWAAAGNGPIAAAVLSAAVSAASGVLALWWMLRAAEQPVVPTETPTPTPAPTPRGEDDEADATSLTDDAARGRPPGPGERPRGGRRGFVRAAGVTAAAAFVSAGAGRYLLQRQSVASVRQAVSLPSLPAGAPTPPDAVSFDLAGLHPWLTPNEDFYRIDTALQVPQIDPQSWSMMVTGMVDAPFELTYDDLLSMPLEEHYITLACVSNEVGGELVDNARWLGVRLDALLERAGVQPGADQVVGRSVDGFSAGFPTEVAFDGRDALVAIGMNGEPLPAEHGFPARLIVPGLFGYVSATKWLSEIELTTLAGFDAYWIPRGWAKFGPIVTQSQIDVPQAGATVPAGTVAVAGLAYAPTRGIARVQVQVDDGPWRDAELAAAYNDDTWRQWRYSWTAAPGSHRLTVRATDGNEEVQIAEVSPVVPDGATGLHTIEVQVT